LWEANIGEPRQHHLVEWVFLITVYLLEHLREVCAAGSQQLIRKGFDEVAKDNRVRVLW